MLFSATMSSSFVEMQGAVMRDAFVFTVSISFFDVGWGAKETVGEKSAREKKGEEETGFWRKLFRSSERKTLVRVEELLSFNTPNYYKR